LQTQIKAFAMGNRTFYKRNNQMKQKNPKIFIKKLLLQWRKKQPAHGIMNDNAPLMASPNQ
jgi:hypothetical protein